MNLGASTFKTPIIYTAYLNEFDAIQCRSDVVEVIKYMEK